VEGVRRQFKEVFCISCRTAQENGKKLLLLTILLHLLREKLELKTKKLGGAKNTFQKKCSLLVPKL